MKQLTKIKISIVFFWTLAVIASAQNLFLNVTDAQTGDTIAFPSAVYRQTKIVAAGNNHGQITIERRNGATLEIKALGYKSKRIKVSEQTPEQLAVMLISDVKQLEGVVVKGKKRTKYSRKNNPAVDLMRRVIAAKKHTRLESHDFYQFEKYQKITMAINNLTPEEMEGGLFRSSPWLKEQVERCPYNDKLILPFSVDETFTEHIYRREPQAQKQIVKGQSTKGVSQLIQTGSTLNTIVKDLFKDINLYDEQIDLLQKRFPSPIGSTAVAFYHFYIDDTLKVGNDDCIRLQFMPANTQDFGFRGELYVTLDSLPRVRKCDMQLPAKTGVNFVDAMKIQQEFDRLPNGDIVLTADNIIAELQLTELLRRIIIIRTTGMTNYVFDPIDPQRFKGRAEMVYDPDAKLRKEDFWAAHRTVGLTAKESEMGSFIQKMGQTRHFKWIMFGVRAFVENFIETSKAGQPSKIDIGPINTLISKNYVDDIRLRAAARTTSYFNPHWFFDAYYAYGTKSQRHYYGAKAIYSFNKPEYQPIEFPIRTLSVESYYDIESPSDRYLKHNKDNIFMTFRPVKVDKLYLYRRQVLNFTWETDYGLAANINFTTENNRTMGRLVYEKMDGTIVGKVRMTSLTLGLEYRPGQNYINSKQQRIEVNLDAPSYTLTHEMGIKNLFGSHFRYHKTEASIYKRFWMGSWGHLDTRLLAGAQWSKVPYHLLIMPPVNTSYFEHQGTFNLMENMEFLNDRYLQFNLAWDLSGKVFNRIPFIKKLKWREYIALKGMWGNLTTKNNPFLPANQHDTELYKFPEGSKVMTHDPYMEMVIGVHNIFKCLEVDYVRRLTYNAPGISRHGIRFGFNLVF